MSEIVPLGETPAGEGDDNERISTTLKDIGSRLPAYAQLSQGLVAAGLMSANQQSDVLGPLGYGPLARVSRFVPLLNQVTRILTLVGAIRFALTQLEPEVADQHLASVGLSREQVEADFENARGLVARAATSGSEHAARAYEVGKEQAARAVEAGGPMASKALEEGARAAGKLTGKGIKAFRRWQAKSSARRDEGSGQGP